MKLGIKRKDTNKIIPEGEEGRKRKERKRIEEDEIRKGEKSLSVS